MSSNLSHSQFDRLRFPPMLDFLPKDIIDTLFEILSMTSKRNFIRCNKELNLKKNLMKIYENEFMTHTKILYEDHLPLYVLY